MALKSDEHEELLKCKLLLKETAAKEDREQN